MGGHNHLHFLHVFSSSRIPWLNHSGGSAPLSHPVVAVPPCGGSAPIVMKQRHRWSRTAIRCRNDLIAIYDDEIDEGHARQYSDGTCSCLQCMFLAKKNRWRTLSRMTCDPRFTWIRHCTTGLGCVVCWATGTDNTELARCQGGPGSLRYTTLRRHTQTSAHRNCEAELFDKTKKGMAAPSPKEFKSLWEGVRTGKHKSWSVTPASFATWSGASRKPFGLVIGSSFRGRLPCQ